MVAALHGHARAVGEIEVDGLRRDHRIPVRAFPRPCARGDRRLYDAHVSRFLHTMVRITDPERSRAFYEALGFGFERDMDIVRDGELEATNYFYGTGDSESVL